LPEDWLALISDNRLEGIAGVPSCFRAMRSGSLCVIVLAKRVACGEHFAVTALSDCGKGMRMMRLAVCSASCSAGSVGDETLSELAVWIVPGVQRICAGCRATTGMVGRLTIFCAVADMTDAG